MSQKQVKRYRRMIIRTQDKMIKKFIEKVYEYSFWERLKFAWIYC